MAPSRNDNATRRELLVRAAGATAALTVGGEVLASAARAATAKPSHALGFRSLSDEVRLPHVPVEGDLPGWLSGVLLRNGPAQFEVGERTFNHWFDGLAMLHAFAFGRGRVSYANRFLRSSAYEAWKRDGVIAYSEFGTDPCRSAFSGVSSIPILAPVPNANVSIEALARTFVAHTEIPIPVRFGKDTLKTLGVTAQAPAGRLGTVHPHHDPATGERFSYEVDLAPPYGYRVLAERKGKRRVLATIPRDKPCYMHSFALTERHVVLIEQPFVVDPASFFTGAPRPIVEHYGWDASLPARALVIDRRGGGLRATIELEPMFVFHNINATERDGQVLLDVCAYADAEVVDSLAIKRLRAGRRSLPRVRPRRITLDLAKRRGTIRDLADVDFELPRVRYEQVNQRPYRYAYGIGVRPGSAFSDQLVKLDAARESHTTWHERGCFPGEPIFVARPGARGEDHGVLLSVVLDAEHRRSFLLVLDARTMTERARASVPHHIPFGFHGLHVPR
ncbi:MAG: carotenoid oxygenase family protein [Solirubrobacteraceae bacterium]